MSYVYGQTAPKILANLEALRVSRPRLFLDLCSLGLFFYFASSLFFCLPLFLFFFFSFSLFLPNRRSTFVRGRAIGIENLGMAITSIIYATIFQTLLVILALDNSTNLAI